MCYESVISGPHETMCILFGVHWAIPLNRNKYTPYRRPLIKSRGSQRINYSFVPGGYKICHCPREVATVCDCPGGVRAFYNTLGLQ